MRIIVLIIVLFIISACSKNMVYNNQPEEHKKIRLAAVAGQFYPANVDELKNKIRGYLAEVKQPPVVGPVAAIMVPHAGYVFSGTIAAYGYSLLKEKETATVIIVCNSHTAYFKGVAVDDSNIWQTPLGEVEVDRELALKIVEASPNIYFSGEVHDNDHTLEVQLPFLQTVLKGNFKIVPILFGNTGEELYLDLAEALKNNLGDNDVVVFSTDMSHYPSYEDANKIDKKTLELISKGDIEALEAHKEEVTALGIKNEETVLCGVDGIKTAMKLMSEGFWGKAKILSYLNSGDTEHGDKERVVGYGAIVFGRQAESKLSAREAGKSKVESKLTVEQQNILLKIAQETVEAKVKEEKLPDFDIRDERLNWQEGCFVTLHKNKKLRGCIGQIIPSSKPLWQVVRDMAIAAATEDYRFKPVSKEDLPSLDYEVSVLSRPKQIDNWQDIELGKHGVIVGQGFNSGVFLPQVATETGWDKETFLSELCSQKAGLATDCYKDSKTEIQIFTAQVFGDKDK